MKAKLIRAVIEWLNRRYPYLMIDVVIPQNAHIHKNPVKKPKGLEAQEEGV